MKETPLTNSPGGTVSSLHSFALGGNKVESIGVSVMKGLQQFVCPQSLVLQPVFGALHTFQIFSSQ